MKVMFVIPTKPYSILLKKCEITSAEYGALTNGVIEHRPNGDEVEILCDDEQARLIIDFVTRVAPEVLSAIRQIDLPPDL